MLQNIASGKYSRLGSDIWRIINMLDLYTHITKAKICLAIAEIRDSGRDCSHYMQGNKGDQLQMHVGEF